MPTNALTSVNLTAGSASLTLPSFNPPVVISDYALDNGMITFHTLCDRIYVCTGPITDFNSVISTALGYNNFGTGNAFGGINNGVPSGRTVTSIAFTTGTITTSGLAICWAAVDFADSHLLAWGVLSGDVQVQQGQLFGLPSFVIHEPAWFSGANITIPFTATSIASQAANMGQPFGTSHLTSNSLATQAASMSGFAGLQSTGFDLNFVTGAYYPGAPSAELVDTRSTIKFLTDAFGNIASVPGNTLPLNATGLLVEPAATKILLQSNSFTTTPWSLANGVSVAPVVTANFAISPDGSTNASKIVFPSFSGAGNSSNYSQVQQVVTVTSGPSYVASIYLKGSVGGEVLYLYSLTGSTYATTTCTLTTSWQRFQVTFASGATSTTISLGYNGGNPSVANQSACTIYAYEAELELGTVASSPFPTATIPLIRSADSIVMLPSLIERYIFTFDDDSTQIIDTAPYIIIGTPMTAFNFVPIRSNSFGTPSLTPMLSYPLGANNLAAGSAGIVTATMGKTYFVSTGGNNTSSGLSQTTPWATVAKVNASTFNPADVVSFAGGQTFTDATLTPPSSGSTAGQVIFTSYGTGRATISPASSGGLQITDKDYVTVDGINFSCATTFNCIDLSANTGPHTSITVQNFSAIGGGGCYIGGDTGTAGWNNVMVQNFTISNQTGDGLGIYGSGGSGVKVHGNITVQNGTINGSGLNGSYFGNVNGGLMSNVVAFNNGASSTAGPVGLWTYESNNVTIQFCESYNNTSSNTTDGDGFDIDGGCTNCIIEYCYAHGNYGAGFLCWNYTGVTWNNNTIRYCIGENNGTDTSAFYGEVTMGFSGTACTNAFIYNNTFFNNLAGGRSIFTIESAGMTGHVANNIFYSAANTGLIFTASGVNPTGIQFSGNDYYATGTFSILWNGTTYSTLSSWQTASSQELISNANVGLTLNPLLSNPGNGGTVGGYSQFKPAAYELNVGSPMVGAGLNLNSLFSINPGSQDFYGHPNAVNYFSVGAASVTANILLDLNFLTGVYYPGTPAVELSDARASPKFIADGSGNLTQIAANVLPLNATGLMVEGSSTNLQTHSLYDSVATTNSVTILSNAALGPDGTTTAFSMVDNSSTSQHYISLAQSAFTAGINYTFSRYYKANPATTVQMTTSNVAFGTGYANFSLSGSGSVTASSGLVSSGITAYSNGWYRCWIVIAATASTNDGCLDVLINSVTAIRLPSYVGIGTGVYVWNAQTEQNAPPYLPTSAIETTTAASTRNADLISALPSGITKFIFTFSDGSTQTVNYVTTNSVLIAGNLSAGAAGLGSSTVSPISVIAPNMLRSGAAGVSPSQMKVTSNLSPNNLASHAAGLMSPVLTYNVILSPSALMSHADGLGNPALTASSGGGTPVVTGGNANLTLPVTQNQNVLLASATNSPTSWAITAGDIWGNFGISSTGQIFINYVDIPPQTYTLTVQATNASGSGTGTVTVVVGVHGTIYHIATSGSDGNSGTSQTSAWATFAHAATIVNPGDAVLVHAGTYGPLSSLAISRGGSSSFPVIWAPFGTDSVTVTATTGGSGQFATMSSYTIFMGFTINGNNSTTAVASGGLTGLGILNCTNVYVSHLTITQFSNTGIMAQTGAGNHSIMFCTVFENCLNDYNNAFGNAGGWGAGMGIYTTNTLVHGCTVYHNWGEGIDSINANGVTTSGCLVWDNMGPGIYITQSENCTVFGNLVYYTGSATWKRSSGAIAAGLQTDNETTGTGVNPLSGNKFLNNIVIGNEYGFAYWDYEPVGMQNCIVANNTFVNILYANLNIDADANTTGCIFENNIFYGGGSPPIGSTTGCTFRNNCWYIETRSGGFVGSGDITTNPQFTGTVGSFTASAYQVASSSPCKGTGFNASATFTTDYGGNVRGSNWTIGAWQ